MLEAGEPKVGTPMPEVFEAVADPRPNDGPWPEMVWPPAADARLIGSTVELTVLNPLQDSTPVPELFTALDHDVVWPHMPKRPLDPIELGIQLQNSRALGRIPWLVRLRRPLAGLDAGTIVGYSSFVDISVADARVEIAGTAYTPPVWASAVNPETKLLLLGHAFDVLHAGRVQLKTDVRNIRSQQAIARLGAQYEGTLRRHQRRPDGSVRDSVMFSVVAEDWPAVREGLRKRLDT